MTPDRARFVETYCSGCNHSKSDCDNYTKNGAIKCCPDCQHEYVKQADMVLLLAAEFTAGVEWGIKHMSQRTAWPLSWDAGFPGLKAQALIDRAAAQVDELARLLTVPIDAEAAVHAARADERHKADQHIATLERRNKWLEEAMRDAADLADSKTNDGTGVAIMLREGLAAEPKE